MNFTAVAEIPDVSFYQDANTTPQKIDFVKMRTQCEGVIIRAGQKDWIDEDFIYNWAAAKAAGLQRGAYWFYDSRATPGQQADLWKAAVGNDMPEWGLWGDLEESYGGAYKGESNWKRFFELVGVNFPGVQRGVYTADWWWSQQYVIQPEYWRVYPLWVAGYDPVQYVKVPKPWLVKGAVLWQYTAKGNGPAHGAESLNIDLNKTSQAFYDLFGGGTTPPPNGGNMYQCTVKASATPYVNIRQAASTSSADIGNVYPGDVFQADKVENGFYHAVSPFTGYVGAQYCDAVVITPPPVPEIKTVIEVTQDSAGATTGVKVDGQAWVKG